MDRTGAGETFLPLLKITQGRKDKNFLPYVYYEVIKRELKRRRIYECRCDERLKVKASIFYYESIKREIQIKPIYDCRCDERLQTKTKRFTRLSYTGLVVELEHLKIKTRLTNEKFASVKGECEI